MAASAAVAQALAEDYAKVVGMTEDLRSIKEHLDHIRLCFISLTALAYAAAIFHLIFRYVDHRRQTRNEYDLAAARSQRFDLEQQIAAERYEHLRANPWDNPTNPYAHAPGPPEDMNLPPPPSHFYSPSLSQNASQHNLNSKDEEITLVTTSMAEAAMNNPTSLPAYTDDDGGGPPLSDYAQIRRLGSSGSIKRQGFVKRLPTLEERSFDGDAPPNMDLYNRGASPHQFQQTPPNTPPKPPSPFPPQHQHHQQHISSSSPGHVSDYRSPRDSPGGGLGSASQMKDSSGTTMTYESGSISPGHRSMTRSYSPEGLGDETVIRGRTSYIS